MKISRRFQIIAGVLLILIGVGFLTPQGAQIAHAATTFLGLTDTPANYTNDAYAPATVNAGETALYFPAHVEITDYKVKAHYFDAKSPADQDNVHYYFYNEGAPSSGDKVMYGWGMYADNEDARFIGYDGVTKTFIGTDWDTGALILDAPGSVAVTHDLSANNLHAGSDVCADDDVEAGDDLIVADDATITDQLQVNGAIGVGGPATGGYDLDVDGPARVTGMLVDGPSVVMGDLGVMADMTIYNDLAVGHNITADGLMQADMVYGETFILGGDIFGENIHTNTGDIYTSNAGNNIYTDQGDINSGGDLTVDDNLGIGEYAAASNDYNAVAQHAQGHFSANGDAQYERYVLLRATTFNDATWRELWLSGAGSRLDPPTDTAWTFRVQIIVVTDGMGETASYEITGSVHDASGTVTVEVATVTTIYEDDASWDAQLTTSGGGIGIFVRDSDGDGDAVRAVATIEIASVTY